MKSSRAIEAKITLLLVLGFLSSFAFAGTSKVSSEDFNAMIVENIKAEKELQKEVQQTVGIDKLSTKMQPHLKIKAEDRETGVDPIAVQSPEQIFKSRKLSNKERARLDRKSLERISSELKEETP